MSDVPHIEILDPENQPGSGKIQLGSGYGSRALGLLEDTKSMKTKKKAYKIISNIHSKVF